MNRKLNSLWALAFAALVLVMSSCGDDDDKESPSRMALITAHTWKYSTVEISAPGANQDEIDEAKELMNGIYGTAEYTFKTDKTYTGKFFGLDTSGTWDFANGEKTLVLDGDADTTFEISTLKGGQLDLKLAEGTASIVLKFVKK